MVRERGLKLVFNVTSIRGARMSAEANMYDTIKRRIDPRHEPTNSGRLGVGLSCHAGGPVREMNRFLPKSEVSKTRIENC